MSLLPSTEAGYLPYFLLFQGISAWIHTAATYLAPPEATTKQFSGPRTPPHTGLLARTYGMKNVYTGLIRITAAYDIRNRTLYDLAWLTFVGVVVYYSLELFVYRTSRMRELGIVYVLTGIGITWALSQRDHYLS